MTSHLVRNRPTIAHVVYKFDTGGLENGLVNLLNHLPADAYRHVVIALTEVTAFRNRVRRSDVEFHALHKGPGHGWQLYPRLYRLFRHIRPAIVHTRNLAALEAQVPAWAAGVSVRIHGEHGRDVGDLDGSSVKYRIVRRAYRPFVTRYVALSRDLENYLVDAIGVPARRISQIYNGVDVQLFHPRTGTEAEPVDCPFSAPDAWLIGTVGRMQAVKDQLNLAHAFARAMELAPELRARMRLVMVGDGPLRDPVTAFLKQSGLSELAWIPGSRDDIPAILRRLDCFVLPSLAEGISNTILEAMACGKPVIATHVGGNSELVLEGDTGALVPAADPDALARALIRLAGRPAQASAQGAAARKRVEERFSLEAMTEAYRAMYDGLLARSGRPELSDKAASLRFNR